MASDGAPAVSLAAARAASRETGSHWCHFDCGSACWMSEICSAIVGDVMVSERNRSPAPCLAFWAPKLPLTADRKWPPG